MPAPTQNRLAELWRQLGAQGDARPVYEDLVKHYAEPHRAYHNLSHIGECLAEYDAARQGSQPELEMAIWFHDVIYDPRAKDNEQQSADLAVKVIQSAGMSARFGAYVHRLILATRHVAPPNAPDEALLVDIDLAILGQPVHRFDEYEFQIGQEYDWVEASAFTAGRTAILKSFLARPTIYSTDLFQRKYEARARENLARSIVRLER